MRQGDFLIMVRGNKGVYSNPSTILTVKRLDGSIVAEAAAGIANALASVALLSQNQNNLSPQSESMLNQLYTYLSDRSPDLDELLRLMK